MLDTDERAREIIQERISKGLLGPGSDVWGLLDNEEIISDYPLQRYYTGIIFPEKTLINTQDKIDSDEIDKISEEIKSLSEEDILISEKYLDNIQEVSTTEHNELAKNTISQNNFFPNNIGISFALEKSIKSISVVFCFGLYYQPKKQHEIKIKISEEGYKSFFDEKIQNQLSFNNVLKYENGFMYLEKPLVGNKGGHNTRSENYKDFDEFKKKENIKDLPVSKYIIYLEKLIGRVWKRKSYNITEEINIQNTKKSIKLKLDEHKNKHVEVSYNIRVIEKNNLNYIKVQLVNTSSKQPSNKFSNKNEALNSKCLFQSYIKIESKNILSYKPDNYFDPDNYDEEAQEIDFIYRNIKNYAVGHNCSVNWSDETGNIKLETTFIPKQDIKDINNEINDDSIEDILKIKNLSIWGFEQNKIFNHLDNFVEKYKKWIENQEYKNNNLSKNESQIGNRIIERQKSNYNRLKAGILLLKNEKVFKAFQIANTSMFLQIIISIDENFCKKEKDISEINNNIDFKSLSFFEDYSSDSIKYRPFQLAFLLLNIDGIINPEGKSRKEIVDLIWFPTGGGKTEAYLALTAFTIAYRRINNDKGFEGTTVIMRYTLRLLTAQQFERASRLISVLEYLRRQDILKNYLKNEPITIGLWVGQSSTPNSLKESDKEIKKINEECEKKDGDPISKNSFQISSCPWCGTKIISKENDIWKYGFKIEGRKGKEQFKISCINKKCFFNDEIPVQVVDEMLYKNPPTLLFGTVDKFAMLSWQDKGHNFFNSFNESLPPDLIIQDELHLLSGPLGSIVGIYESIIEILCTKNNIGPKIIASTATTRNTEYQVSNLYGNRKVNIFPPSGINYDDSYFAKESSTNSKRRYIGFIPTGKTSIDTQLQMLAHLLVARLEIFSNTDLKNSTKSYWTIVSYYNSLKDVGKIFNKVGDEVKGSTSILQNRLRDIFQPFENYNFNFGIPNRTKELTSRIESSKIKSTLKEIEDEFNCSKIQYSEKGNSYLNDVVDLVLATNMISVGIDIKTLNIMLLNGMPKNIAEYIQASSRIGRSTKGLAITLLDPNRAREKSYFEHFKNFHQAFYKYVEPLSITPFTENTINKMLSSMIISFIRNKVPNMSGDNQAQYFEKEMLDKLKEFINQRFYNHTQELKIFEEKIEKLSNDWKDRIESGVKLYKSNSHNNGLLKKPNESDETYPWRLMQSLREIDTNTYIQIKEDFTNV